MKEANEYTTMEKNGEIYVLRPRRRANGYNDASFMNTGLALSGVLKRGQSLQSWIFKRINISQMTDSHFRNIKYNN